MPPKRATYRDRAERLTKTIDIAADILRASTTLPEDEKNHLLAWGQEIKRMALHPEPPFKNIASIRYLENDFMTYWNESDGPDIEKFWVELHKNDVDFEHKDTLQAVLKRKEIKDIYEYDYVIDHIVVAKQIGRINQEQMRELSRLIGEFERRRSDKKK